MAKHIEITQITPLRGPNRWTYRPVLEALVDIGELEDYPSNTLNGFVARLSAYLPSLSEHRCSYGEPGGFLRRLDEGTWSGHILEHVTLELQNLAGIPGGFGRARETSKHAVYTVVISAFDEHLTEVALLSARDLVMAAIEDRPFAVAAAIENLKTRRDALGLSPITLGLITAAEQRGIPCRRLGAGELLQLGHGANQQCLRLTDTERTSAIADGIARDRELSHELLSSCGLPLVNFTRTTSVDAACAAAAEYGDAVVMKAGTAVPQIVVDPRDRGVIERVFNALGDGETVIEPFLAAHEYRLLMVGGKLIWAIEEPRGVAPARPRPSRAAALDVTDRVHPSFVQAAALAARVVGLNIAVVACVAEHIDGSITEQAAGIIDLTSGGSFLSAVMPSPDALPRICDAILTHLFPAGTTGRLPLVGITGASGTSATAALLGRLLQLSGKRVGRAAPDGIYVDQRRLPGRTKTVWEATQCLLANRRVEIAVVENGAGAIAGEGLGYDRCAVGVVTNMDPNATLPQQAIDNPDQVYAVLRTQVDVVLPTGIAVLNGVDPWVMRMLPLCDGEVIVYAVLGHTAAVIEHRARGGRAVFVRDGRLVLARGAEEMVLPEFTRADAASDFNWNGDVQTITAAAAAAWALELPPELIHAGLETYAGELAATR